MMVTKHPSRASATNRQGGGLADDAVARCRRAIEFEPGRAEPHFRLGDLLAQQGNPEEAADCYRRALALEPGMAAAHHNLAAALMVQSRLDEALGHLRQALALDPNLVQAHLNIGNVLLAQSRYADAAAQYRRGLAIRADFPKAQHGLGLALAMQGHLVEAVARFEQAIALKADYCDAYNDLARTLWKLDRPDEALRILAKAIAGGAATAETKGLFVQFLREHRGAPRVDNLAGLLAQALSEPWSRPGKVGLVASPLIRNDMQLRPSIARAAAAWPRRLSGRELWDQPGRAALFAHRLLAALLKSAPVCDVALERFLTNVRFAMLEAATAAPAAAIEQEAVDFCCALAQQCFLNEYVYDCTEAEADQAQGLCSSVASALASGATVSSLELAALACYLPLHSLPRPDALLERTWPAAAIELLHQQVREPARERELQRSVPALTEIEDSVSVAVRQQYEENPFPRWVKSEPPPARPRAIDQHVREKFPLAPLRPLGKAAADILVAGCGTGQQAIETAQKFSHAQVLAVDLSRSSLGYAKRQTLALGLKRIEYAQADILKLASCGRTFDLIVVSGVLHHLAEPFAGWRVLRSLLRPGGLMAVGLYSELARAHIKAARDFIAARGYRPSAEDIRRCRQELIALPAAAPERKVVRVKDFFSTSECRDLLFHVQEHRLTLPQIAGFLGENGLTFLGFDLGEQEREKYRARFPDDPAMTNLACWHDFERANPDTFMGMYQFWAQAS